MNLVESNDHPPVLDQKILDPFASIGHPTLDCLHQDYDEIKGKCKYYTLPPTPELSSMPSTLEIVHVNARSILSDDKFEQFQTFLHRAGHRWSVICVSETWLSKDMEKF